MFNRRYTYTLLLFSIFSLSIFTENYYNLVYAELVLLIFMVIEKLGKGIVLRELIAFHTVLICLFVPIFGYTVYNRYNELASVWVRYMPIDRNRYFGFALPAVTAYSIALTLPFAKHNEYDTGTRLNEILLSVRAKLVNFRHVGFYLISFGIVMLYFSTRAPVSLQFLLNLFWLASFTGFLYVFYSPQSKFRKVVLVGYVLFVLAHAISLGMFTIIAYMGMLLFSFAFLGTKVSIPRKFIYFFSAVFILVLIQSVKPVFRKLTWNEKFEGNKVSLFYNLLVERVSEGDFINEAALFPIYYRTNQGYNISMVMQRIPKIKPHDEGKNLFINLLSSFVPRFLWPDKPEAGGKFNMKYYAGYNLVGYSTNIGPLGEAYGSFGVSGGIVYMFFLGLFIRYAYALIFVIARKLPAILLWLPVLFFQVTYSAEADTLQILNSLIKAGMFVFLIYLLIPKIFLKKVVFDTRKVAIRRAMLKEQFQLDQKGVND